MMKNLNYWEIIWKSDLKYTPFYEINLLSAYTCVCARVYIYIYIYIYIYTKLRIPKGVDILLFDHYVIRVHLVVSKM